MYQIERDVPPPRGKEKYPFGRMEIGDSFAVPHGGAPALIGARLSSAANQRLGPGKCRTEVQGDVVRCWRVA